MLSRTLGHRAPLLWLVLPWMAGIAVGRLAPATPPLPVLAFALLLAGAGALAAWRQKRAWAVLVVTAMGVGGAASYQLHDPRVAGWDELPAREARASIRARRIFPRTDLTVAGVGTVVDGSGAIGELAGQRVYFSLRRRSDQPAPLRSAVFLASGVLEPVAPHPPAGSFDAYLADAGVHFRLGRGDVMDALEPATPYHVFLEHAAVRLNAWLTAGIARKRPDLGAVYRAMMLGQKHELSQEQDAVFMHSGTMHLFAINGLHIGVVAVSLHALLALLRCPRPLAAVLTLAVVWFDVDTTGASPSAVRAFILVACYEAGFVFRRPANGLATLSGAALVVLLIDPNALFSASFQMSYGVVLTILCFGLPLSERLQAELAPFQSLPKAMWTRWQRGWAWLLRELWPMIGIGLAATLVSTITGPEFFRVLAPIGFLSNLVLIPLAMLVIIAGFAAIVAGAVGLLPIAALFNHAALLILVGIDALIRNSIRLPAAWWPAQWRLEWAAPATLGLLIATIVAGYATRWRPERGGWWPPVAVAGLALALGLKYG